MTKHIIKEDYIVIAESIEKGSNFLHRHKWQKDSYATNKFGGDVHPSSDEAVSFCAMGSCIAAAEKGRLDTPVADIHELCREVSGMDLASFNDQKAKSKKEVRTMMKRLAYVARLRAKSTS